MMRHDPNYYHAQYRAVTGSGFVLGRPVAVKYLQSFPKAEAPAHRHFTPEAKALKAARIAEGLRRYHERRREYA